LADQGQSRIRGQIELAGLFDFEAGHGQMGDV
jgi:hypothetical protein